MDDGEILALRPAGDARDGVEGGGAQGAHLVEVEIAGVHGGGFGRQGGKEAAGKVERANQLAKLGAIGAVPGDDGIELAQLVEQAGGRIGDAQQVEPGGADGAHAVGKAHQGDVGRGRPDLEIAGAQGFEGWQGDDEVADGAGADDKSSHHAQYAKNRNGDARFIHSECTGAVL